MKIKNNLLIIRQLDKRLPGLQFQKDILIPKDGWVNLIRKTLGMSMRQLGNRMSITPQGVQNIETREKEETVTIKTLREAAEALDMQLVYGFVPKDGSLEKMIERKAYEMAARIVRRTSTTMNLEDQGNSPDRINQAITEMGYDLKKEMPKQLWD